MTCNQFSDDVSSSFAGSCFQGFSFPGRCRFGWLFVHELHLALVRINDVLDGCFDPASETKRALGSKPAFGAWFDRMDDPDFQLVGAKRHCLGLGPVKTEKLNGVRGELVDQEFGFVGVVVFHKVESGDCALICIAL